jgi:hypothetical protein
MMAQPNGTTETITATVEAVNDHGIKVQGGWLNVSRYHPVALPMRGALVTLEVQGGRWIQRCDVLDGAETVKLISATAPSSARDGMIARHVALKAAVAYCAAREAAKAADVLPLAASFEAWLTRPLAGQEGGHGTPAA